MVPLSPGEERIIDSLNSSNPSMAGLISNSNSMLPR